MNNNIKSIGKLIKQYRLEYGMSQEQLASSSGVERANLSRIEKGEVLGVTYATIERILNSFEKTLIPLNITDTVECNPRPFVKWAGGKTQLLETIYGHLPNSYNRYFEPFVGGGALLFKIKPKESFINDMNSELVAAYSCFKNPELFNSLKEELLLHEKNHSEDYYYTIRSLDRDPLNNLFYYEKAARLIYLNKACFNGLYRVNSNGFFNVPSGKKTKVITFDDNNFEQIRIFFKINKCTITNLDFEEAVKNAKAGDFVYFDPPYDTIEGKSSFTSYNKNAFGKDEQIRLANVFKKLSKKGVFWKA